MKRIVTASAAALITLSGAAFAATDVSGFEASQIRQYAPEINLSLVSPDAVKSAAQAIDDLDDDEASYAAIQNAVRHELNKGQ
ncbi:hypothetical protein [Thalassobius sp. Cn5-15]|uniref:hypothetical protein n=1 Tax=Thalassobius sp. Cn5-15 TaxID=2917763 RepID=UPI001EF32C1D|nr:hypothetical protein [Thalassobius sp. Cn5-15]MCG7492330.1 hypothetical protein [Thalassobius sp. Cn5-15]